jgi:hypothetical protein
VLTPRLLMGSAEGPGLPLISALSHFPELVAKLEVLRIGCNMGLMEDRMGALWIQACPASDSLASHILPSVARGPPNGVGE